jgi:hypothetical protein
VRAEDGGERLLNDFARDFRVLGECSVRCGDHSRAPAPFETRKTSRALRHDGGQDEWAHERRYDLYLDAIHRSDDFLRVLWETVQRMPEYGGRTALLVATDHGRGSGTDWTDPRA